MNLKIIFIIIVSMILASIAIFNKNAGLIVENSAATEKRVNGKGSLELEIKTKDPHPKIPSKTVHIALDESLIGLSKEEAERILKIRETRLEKYTDMIRTSYNDYFDSAGIPPDIKESILIELIASFEVRMGLISDYYEGRLPEKDYYERMQTYSPAMVVSQQLDLDQLRSFLNWEVARQ